MDTSDASIPDNGREIAPAGLQPGRVMVGGNRVPRVPALAWRRLRIVLCLLFCSTVYLGLGLVLPTLARAESHLQIGDDARTATDLLLRAAPGYDATVVMPVAAETTVRVLDGPVAAADGSLWYGVAVSGEDGFLPGGSLAGSAEVDEASDPGVSGAAQNDSSGSQVEAAVVGERAIVTTALNLRAGPSTSDAVLLVMPGGATVTLTGNSANGFLSVTYNGVAGWAYGSYLSTTGNPSPDPAPGGGGGSGIIWPVQGGTWHIIQGYNGGTHQNRSASAQYYYSLDIARVDGNTAGQPVLSPVSGTVRWVHPASGGIAIDMGNGYILAMFHCAFAGSLGSGQTVQQGQYLGTISGPGGNGYAGTPHIDITLWHSSDGGSTRSSSPFSGANGISRVSFPDVGGWNQHYGFQFNP